MHGTGIDALEKRVDRLERENRRLRRVGGGMVALLLAAGVSAAGSGPQVIEGRGLRIIDEDGRVRAELRVDKDRSVLLLHDENGKERATLGARKDGSGLGLKDDRGKVRASLTTSNEGGRLALFDENMKAIWGGP